MEQLMKPLRQRQVVAGRLKITGVMASAVHQEGPGGVCVLEVTLPSVHPTLMGSCGAVDANATSTTAVKMEIAGRYREFVIDTSPYVGQKMGIVNSPVVMWSFAEHEIAGWRPLHFRLALGDWIYWDGPLWLWR